MAKTYETYYREDNAALHPLTEARYQVILKRLERGRGPGRLLDVGCGAGQFLEAAKRHGWAAEGTEVSTAATPFLDARGVVVHRGDLTELSLTGPYDAITLFEVLEHVPCPQAYLESARRLLSPGGLLFLTTPNFDGLSRRLLGVRWRVLAVEHLCYYSVPALRAGFAKAGLATVSMRTKNLDVVDLRHKFFSRGGLPEGHSNIAETTALRERIEGRRAIRVAKAMVNNLLALTGSGDTLEAYAAAPQSLASSS